LSDDSTDKIHMNVHCTVVTKKMS